MPDSSENLKNAREKSFFSFFSVLSAKESVNKISEEETEVVFFILDFEFALLPTIPFSPSLLMELAITIDNVAYLPSHFTFKNLPASSASGAKVLTGSLWYKIPRGWSEFHFASPSTRKK